MDGQYFYTHLKLEQTAKGNYQASVSCLKATTEEAADELRKGIQLVKKVALDEGLKLTDDPSLAK